MAKKAVKKGAKKSKTAAPATVHIHAKSLESLKKAARKAGLAKDFKSAIGKTKKAVFVQVNRNNFDKLKELAGHEKLATPHSLSNCDCDPNDPFCFCM